MTKRFHRLQGKQMFHNDLSLKCVVLWQNRVVLRTLWYSEGIKGHMRLNGCFLYNFCLSLVILWNKCIRFTTNQFLTLCHYWQPWIMFIIDETDKFVKWFNVCYSSRLPFCFSLILTIFSNLSKLAVLLWIME